MQMKLLAFLLAAGALPAAAQDTDHIETHRPSETISSKLVEKKTFQEELGLRREHAEPEIEVTHPNSVLRYGLSKAFELRLQVEPVTVHDRISGGTENGLLPLEPGLKARICEERGARPSISF
jgi:hypothetical protein